MKRRLLIGVVLLLALLVSGPVFACLWDYDTLEMERQRYPTTLETITGKFLRHSREFYYWRIEDRTKRLAAHPNDLSLYDDLAVAYEKTGDHQKAIETILKKEKLKPGLYETYANLGTFYIHDGQFEKGLKELERAIKINPNAHFGREVYQKLLVEYVMSRKVRGKIPLPLSDENDRSRRPEPGKSITFADFVLGESLGKPNDDQLSEIQKATKGVLGMMRFGNYKSPILLEALGDLLHWGGAKSSARDDGKRLAVRAYLRASYVVTDKESAAAYRRLAEHACTWQTVRSDRGDQLVLADEEARFKKELKEADDWYAVVVRHEDEWIKSGVNVDESFKAKFYHEPEITRDYSDGPPGDNTGPSAALVKEYVRWGIIVFASVFLAILVVVATVILRGRRRYRQQDAAWAAHREDE